MLDPKERDYLRELACQLKEIADKPLWAEKSDLWRRINSLEKVRPLVLCAIPEETWYELIPDSELCIDDNVFSGYEWELKKRIYRWLFFRIYSEY